MHPQDKMLFSLLVVGLLACTSATVENNEIAQPTADRQAKLGLLNTGASTIAQLAQDLFSRSTTSSQVLSLNLTNLVILVVIKALIFGAGHLGLGGHDGGLGRSLPQEPFMSQGDVQLMLSYMEGEASQQYDCLHYTACGEPTKTRQYLTAAKMISNAANVLGMSGSGSKYDSLLSEVEEAVQFGTKGYDCSAKYSCQISKS